MFRQFLSVPVILAVSLALQACPGGGGGAETGASGQVRFVSWSLTSPSTVSVSDTTTTTGTASASDTSISVSAGAASVSFDANNGDNFVSEGPVNGVSIVAAGSADGDRFGLAVNLSYNSFGAWLTGYNSGAGFVGVGSFGLPTQASSVPTAGGASYSGASVGFYKDGVGTPYLTASEVSVSVNFNTPSFTMNTSSTEMWSLISGAGSSNPGLNLSGGGSISGAGLNGTLASNNGMSGPVNGTLYGPNAQEVGGTWDLNGGGQKYIASFGARQ